MSIDKLLSKQINRREFLEKAGKGAAALALLASGCASTLKENRKDIAGIGWGCNPILPIPAMGCYVGTNNEATNPESERYIIESFKEKYGIQPAFNNILPKFRVANSYFPTDLC